MICQQSSLLSTQARLVFQGAQVSQDPEVLLEIQDPEGFQDQLEPPEPLATSGLLDHEASPGQLVLRDFKAFQVRTELTKGLQHFPIGPLHSGLAVRRNQFLASF